jgi:hypothetical protein
MNRLMVAVLTMLLAIASGAYADMKDEYRPVHEGYPQIIQATDRATISAIEALYSSIKGLPKGDVECVTTGNSIILSVRGCAGCDIVVSVPANGPVRFSKRAYKRVRTLQLFGTLRKLLADLSVKTSCRGLQYERFLIRGRCRTTIEFDFGPKVVQIDAFNPLYTSDGPEIDTESLYVLDLLDRERSFFWGQF